jgi:hypothetical protein
MTLFAAPPDRSRAARCRHVCPVALAPALQADRLALTTDDKVVLGCLKAGCGTQPHFWFVADPATKRPLRRNCCYRTGWSEGETDHPAPGRAEMAGRSWKQVSHVVEIHFCARGKATVLAHLMS